ncbi:uncharacterized protein LOC134062627 [Sardina pilchardus]|uniref:uncharacterized protein LOC134062627 n=1 Tax=Sardina pilchardus TaxID=27697 RepID=UPI002E14F5F5
MVSTGVAACIMALVCACCMSDSTQSFGNRYPWNQERQQSVHAVVEYTGVQEHKSKLSDVPGITPERKWEMPKYLVKNPSGRHFPQAPMLNNQKILVSDWQGNEAWDESNHQEPQQPTTTPPVRAIWVTRFPDAKMFQKTKYSADDPIQSPELRILRSPAPTAELPTDYFPTSEIPTDELPTDYFPTSDTLADEFPTIEASTDDYPIHEILADELPTSKASTDELPTDYFPTRDTLADEFPTIEASTDDYPIREILADELPTSKASTNELPTDYFPTSDALADEFPTIEALTDDYPIRETLTDELPTSETITESFQDQNPLPPRIVKEPEAPQSVIVHCGESLLHLQVKRDFFGTGQLISPSNITLGGCAPTGLNSSSDMLLFETELHKCGSRVQMTDNLLVYKFTLSYTAVSTENPLILRTRDAVVNISCQYPRLQNVSSSGLMPTWMPLHHTKASNATLDFSLKLMTDDWTSERASGKYFLGHIMNIAASVNQSHHAPFHVFVEDCVASLKLGKQADPAYFLIEKHGCLSDSKLANSRSRFMPTTQDDMLRFQLETFRFAGASKSPLYITCTLVAVLNTSIADGIHKACHFSKEKDRWVSASGNDQVCNCCEAQKCPQRTTRSLNDFKRSIVLGPITILKRIPAKESPGLFSFP